MKTDSIRFPGRLETRALDGDEFEIVDAGSGPPLVLLPPLPGWKAAFVELVPRLAAAHRVITFDLRTRFDGAPSWDRLVDDAEAIAAARFDGPIHLFGHSFGGALAMQWALRHPRRVRSLALSSSFARVFTPRSAWAARWLEQPAVLAGMRWLPDPLSARFAWSTARRRGWVFDEFCSREVVERVRAGVRSTPIALIRSRVAMAMSLDLRPRFGEIRVPTLLLHAERDTPFAIEATAELARAMPGAERCVIPGAGHLHPMSRPDDLARAIEEWVARVSAKQE